MWDLYITLQRRRHYLVGMLPGIPRGDAKKNEMVVISSLKVFLMCTTASFVPDQLWLII